MAICIALVFFCEMYFVSQVVYLTGGFADVKRLAFGADNGVNHSGADNAVNGADNAVIET